MSIPALALPSPLHSLPVVTFLLAPPELVKKKVKKKPVLKLILILFQIVSSSEFCTAPNHSIQTLLYHVTELPLVKYCIYKLFATFEDFHYYRYLRAYFCSVQTIMIAIYCIYVYKNII